MAGREALQRHSSFEEDLFPSNRGVDGGLFHLNNVLELERKPQNGSMDHRR